MRITSRGAAAVLTTCLAAAPMALLAAPPASAADADVRINEIESNGDPVGDWVELVNNGTSAVDISGWRVVDNDVTHTPISVPAGTTLAPGAFFSIYTEVGQTSGFGLGGADAVTVSTSTGTQVDTHAWTAHAARSYGRCPDGAGPFVDTTTTTRGAANDCPPPAGGADVRLNEVESNGDAVGDWVELVNVGTSALDISGWKVIDSDATHPFAVVPAATVLDPGEYVALYTEFPPPGFGLGSSDTVRLYQADGTTQVDSFSWSGGHAATTFGRCADGVGSWQETTVATRGAANACSPIRVNEVESSDPASGPDWVELVNLSSAPIDVAGWVVKDSGETGATTLPSPSVVPAGGHLVVDALLAGLGGSDAVRLFDSAAKLIDSYAWTAHATTTYGRCADGVGTFKTTDAATKGGVNDCPGLSTVPWLGSQTVTTVDAAATFNADASGLVFDPANPSTLWVAQNKAGTLWKLVKSGDTYVPAKNWESGRAPKYADGTGSPDTEGITIGADKAVYLTSERNNEASGISRNTLLRYAPVPKPTMRATDQWELNGILPALGANLGLEGITFIPDDDLLAGGFVDESTGAPYDPATYPKHRGGLFVVAVEGTGLLYVLALDHTKAVDEVAHLVATIDPQLVTNAGPAGVMDVTWDAELERLWAVCDDSCDGTTVTLALVSGAFVVDTAYQRPAGMPNLNNEGLAIAPRSACVGGVKPVLWADDGDTDGHSLRAGTLPCDGLATMTVTTRPVVRGTARVGKTLRLTPGQTTPKAASLGYQWYVDGLPVAGATGTTLAVQPSYVGKRVRVQVTYAKVGFADATASARSLLIKP
ncbi:lamin tail domain-containing protein [Nocardioides stalactiti]|uniref:lamin tail domain-containing protein n=1 Tax=Nocardioides stalactiti TaxID=2755356 RepID=UPI00160393C1|nr:lamin tail domain-containing protein [Nocardioides stalactiti]